MKRYAIKVPFDDDDDMLYITEGDSKFHLRVKLFTSYDEAEQYAITVWGDQAVVEEYTQESDLL